MITAATGKPHALQALLELGPALGVNWDDKTFQGEVALHFAACFNQTEIISLLVDHKADLSSRDIRQMTPLHHAVARGVENAVEKLVSLGADRSAKDCEGKMPIDFMHKSIFPIYKLRGSDVFKRIELLLTQPSSSKAKESLAVVRAPT